MEFHISRSCLKNIEEGACSCPARGWVLSSDKISIGLGMNRSRRRLDEIGAFGFHSLLQGKWHMRKQGILRVLAFGKPGHALALEQG